MSALSRVAVVACSCFAGVCSCWLIMSVSGESAQQGGPEFAAEGVDPAGPERISALLEALRL